MPQKTLIQKVQFKLWKNNPGPQADTASYVQVESVGYLAQVSKGQVTCSLEVLRPRLQTACKPDEAPYLILVTTS